MAKKKSPAELKQEGAALATLIATARKRDHNFALLIGKEGIVLEADPKKSADVMRRLAKAGGGGAKGAQGVMRVVGKVVEFHCSEEDPPRALRKLAQQHFRERSQQYKIMILTPSGAETGDDDDADATASDNAATPRPSPDATDAASTAVSATDEAGSDAGEGAPNGDSGGQAERLGLEFSTLERRIEAARPGGDKAVLKKADKLAETIRGTLDSDPAKAAKILPLLRTTLDKAGIPDAPDAPSQSGSDPAGLAMPATFDDAMATLGKSFSAMWDKLTAPPPEDPALKAEQAAIAAQREKLSTLYEAGPLDATRALEIASEFARLSAMAQTAQQTEALGKSHPEAANAARDAIAGFDAQLGQGAVVTPEVIAEIEAARVAAELELQAAEGELAKAQALPAGPEQDAAIATAEAEHYRARSMLDGSMAKLKAAKGKQQLVAAITTGGLAPGNPRAFSDKSTAEFVQAFARNPDLATFAVDKAEKSPNPEAVAGGMKMLCDNLENGFAAKDGTLPPKDFDQTGYAKGLIEGAGREGRGFMAGAQRYVEDGHHLKKGAIPTDNGESVDGRARDRTQFIASELLGENGAIEMDKDAETALGHLRFSPETLETPTPEVNRRVLDMYELLKDDTNRAKAEQTLMNMGPPAGRGAELIEMAGSGDSARSAPTADNGRRAVLSSLMTPVHQGKAGSCHATASVRRMSETDPLGVMDRYAELVTTGTFKPANGQREVPAATRFPIDEDPLVRSLEYSTATAMAGMAGRSESLSNMLEGSLDQAIDGLMGPVGDMSTFMSDMGKDNWEVDKKIIRKTLEDSFTVEYSAEEIPATTASDGHSEAGAYVLVQTAPTRRVINSRDLFSEALTERVLAALSIETGSEKALEVEETIQSMSFTEDMINGFGDTPWKMGGGGFPDQGDEILFGGKRARKSLVESDAPWGQTTKEWQGERAATVLEGLVDHFEGESEDMVPLAVFGKASHAFNGLPNHPSLAPLKGDDTGARVEKHLLQPGRDIASKELSEDEAQRIFEDLVGGMTVKNGEAALAVLRASAAKIRIASAPLTPDALGKAIETAMAPLLDDLAKALAATWQEEQIADGKPCTDAERDKKAAQDASAFKKGVAAGVTSKMIGATGAPVFTIADTNWGDAKSKKNFVVAPDPRTGEPRLWEHILPDNKFLPASDDWEKGKWLDVVEVQ